MLVLLICIGLLMIRAEKVSGLRSIDPVLKWNRDNEQSPNTVRSLQAQAMQDLNTQRKPSPESKMFDPNQSNKRSVGRGSDPIHNRGWLVYSIFAHVLIWRGLYGQQC
ncbi:hypothetical protein RJ641_012531 [Dillenia turbinata]|uniref:CLAVATA3/ESR (CLE)-related protein 45 n=1 Tax=Dillenia turbinata TaxID=194707 RepID=A0AAN8UZF1_9MAGN